MNSNFQLSWSPSAVFSPSAARQQLLEGKLQEPPPPPPRPPGAFIQFATRYTGTRYIGKTAIIMDRL